MIGYFKQFCISFAFTQYNTPFQSYWNSKCLWAGSPSKKKNINMCFMPSADFLYPRKSSFYITFKGEQNDS